MRLQFAALLFCLLGSWVSAEQKTEFNGYELHYIVLNTTDLAPEIAQHYDIIRSGKRALINLSVLKQTDDGYGKAVRAEISATQRSLVGQQSKIPLREIKEGSAIYYIGSFRIFDQETLWIDIDVTLEDGNDYDFSFSQKVWQQ